MGLSTPILFAEGILYKGEIVMRKRLLSMLLAVALMASAMTGCGGKNDKEVENVQEDDEEDKATDNSADDILIEPEDEVDSSVDVNWADAYKDYFIREDIIPEKVKLTMSTDMDGVSMDVVVAVVGDSSYMRYAFENAILDLYGTGDMIYAHTVMSGEESWIYAPVTSEEEANGVMNISTDTLIVDAEDVTSCTYVEEVVEDGVIYDVLFLDVNDESVTGDVYYYVNRETQKVDKFTMEQDGQTVECDVEEINSIELPDEAVNATEGTMDDVAGALFAVMFSAVDPNAGETTNTGGGVEVNVISMYFGPPNVDGPKYEDYVKFVCEYDVDGRNIKIYSCDSEGVLTLAEEYYYSDRWDMNKFIRYENGNVSCVYEYGYEYDGDVLLMESKTNYDENGQITWEQVTKYEYNNQGDLIWEIRATDDGEEMYSQITEYVYDEFQNLLSVTGYNESGNISGMSQEYEYNTNGELIKEISYYNDRNICSVTTYEYYETGELFKEIYYDYDHDSQEIHYVIEDEYDLSTNLTRNVYYDSDGYIETNMYEYDSFGNEIKSTNYIGESVEEILVSEYDANGNLLRAIFYDGQNNVVAQDEYIYDEKGNVVEFIYTGEGITEGIKCTYDAKGNRVQLIEYDWQGNMDKYEAEYVTIIAPNEKAAEALLEITSGLEISEVFDYLVR